MTSEPDPIAAVSAAMRRQLDRLPLTSASRREFLQTYLRTTEAVGTAVRNGTFDDPEWVQRWDAAFAGLYLAALDADLSGSGGVPRPWRLAFDAPAALPPLRHVLLGMNAHVNYDLPQALLMVIPDEEFADPLVLARRRRDHERIDDVLARQVRAEDGELARRSARGLLDRVLTPLNRWASRRWLREARQKVWHNAVELQRARIAGRRRTTRGWRSWRSSARRGSGISALPARSSCAWRSTGSASSCRRSAPGDGRGAHTTRSSGGRRRSSGPSSR